MAMRELHTPAGMVWALRQEEFSALLDRVGEAMAAHSSQVLEMLRGIQANDVLFSGTAVVDANGAVEIDWSVSIASVVAFNLDATAVTVVTGRGFPVVGGALTIYGNANAQVDLVVMAAFQAPEPS